MKRFAYFYFNRFDPEKVRLVVPAHVQYWRTSGVADYTGGPFADHSGGLILFSASGLEAVSEIVAHDPFVRQDLIEQKWIKEWVPE